MKEFFLSTIEARNGFFSRRGWKQKQCPFCLENYYTKKDLPNCGSYYCVREYQFLNVPSPKFYLEINECTGRFHNFFTEKEFLFEPPIDLVRNDERTLFASTAGQVYDELIYNRISEKNSKRCILLQPVVRFQHLNSIDKIDGISTSFVHAATECWNITAEEHWKIFDQWLDFFSASGLHVASLCLKSQRADNDWDGRIVTSEMIKINYGGLGIGIANFFFNIPQGAGAVATLSDIGIGLERFIWAVNKSPSYFDSISSIETVASNKIIDAIRTATLITASGVMPNHKNQGSKLRMMIGLIANSQQNLNLYEIIGYYYKQWSLFINLPMHREHVYSVILKEINRNLNIRISRMLKISEPSEQNHEDFLRELVRKKIVSIQNLKNIKKDSKDKNHGQ